MDFKEEIEKRLKQEEDFFIRDKQNVKKLMEKKKLIDNNLEIYIKRNVLRLAKIDIFREILKE